MLLSLVFLVAACVETPRDVSLAERGADALEAGDYTAAEQFLSDALGHNPNNEYALLNLGVIYQDTGRPELARRTYAEIIRINRQERAALIVARKSGNLSPMVLARENLADLNLSPVFVDSGTPPPSWFGNNAPIDSRNFSALYSDMSAVFDKLQGLAESMRLMSDTLRAAAQEAERQQANANGTKPADAAMAMKNMASEETANKKVASLDKNAGDAPAAAKKMKDGDTQTMAPGDKKGDDMGTENGDAQAVARAEPIDGDGPSVRVHIASFRSEAGA